MYLHVYRSDYHLRNILHSGKIIAIAFVAIMHYSTQ